MPARDSAWRDAAPIVIALAAILFFARLGTRALWASEFRWAEIAREMLVTHNYFWPTLNGHVYYDKPLGSYWLVIAATWLTGGMNEAAARIPCAVAGLIAVALVILLTRRLYDLRTGVFAAAVLATSFSFVFFSRHASADVETVAGELAALTLFLRYQHRPIGWWILALWIIMALTSLTKGLLGFVLPLLVIGVYSSFADGWNSFTGGMLLGSLSDRIGYALERHRWFFNWRTPIAIAVAASIYYWPFAISHEQTGSAKGLAMVYRENVVRYFAPFDHVGPIYLYTYVIFALMAPWSVYLPAALAHAHRANQEARTERDRDRFVLSFFWATFIFFTLAGSRRSYYLLPILPAAAILVARLLAEPLDRLSRTARILLKLGFAAIVIAVTVSSLAFLPPRLFMPDPYALLPNAPERGVLAVYWIGSALALCWALRRLTSARVFFATATVAWLFMFYFFVFAMPAGDAWRGEKPFAYRIRDLIGADTAALAFYRVGGPVYYLDLPHSVPTYESRRELDQSINTGATRWVVVRQRDLQILDVPAAVVAREAVFPWDSKEHRLNAMVLVRVGAPPAQESP
ncbi:MAG TPA: glycosyltransferase family 39 protein [Candidatus Binataceae bacterium]|nr:glycosyltransferase family 39 protein [Candidatus Binataceae bacterium]